jgi:hypothetical protein
MVYCQCKYKHPGRSNKTEQKAHRSFEAPCYYKQLNEHQQKVFVGKILSQLGCDDYDRHDDISKLTIKITETLE